MMDWESLGFCIVLTKGTSNSMILKDVTFYDFKECNPCLSSESIQETTVSSC